MAAVSEEVLIDMLKGQLEAFVTLESENLLKTFAEDDCVLQDMAEPANPYRGLGEIKGFLDDYFATLEDAQVEILRTATNADTVVGEIEVKANYVGAPFSPGNGREITLRYVVLDTVRDGKVTHERFYWNPAELERQLSA